MRTKIAILLVLLNLLFASVIFSLAAYAVEERKVLSRNYIGLGVEVYAPYQCYPGENITIKVSVKALEDVKNASVTLFIWGSKSEGQSPWGVSFKVLDVTDFPNGMIKDEEYNITIPSDIDPGLIYGILWLEWSVYRSPSWEEQWDKASFRATYVKNRGYENLQDKYNSLEIELQNSRIMAYIFTVTTIALAASTVYLAKKKRK